MHSLNFQVRNDSHYYQNITAELFNLIYNQAMPAIAGSLIVASCLVFGLHNVVSAHLLYGWYTLMIVVTITRYAFVKMYLRKQRSMENSILWGKIFICMLAFAGVSWSLAGTLIIPESSIHQTFIATSLAGVAAGAIPFFSGSRAACFVFIIPVLLPFAMWSFLHADTPHQLLGFLTILYMGLLLIACFRTHKAVYNAIKLKFQNDELVKNLRLTKSTLEKMNGELQNEVNDRKYAEKLLRESEEQYRLVTDALPVLISYLDMNLHYRFINKAHADWFGMPLNKISGKSIKAVLGHSIFEIFDEHIKKLRSQDTVNFETIMHFHHDDERYVSVTLIPHIKEGVMEGFFSLINDTTPRINHLATHDSLTDLPNRSLFNARFLRILNRCKLNHSKLAILFLDLDHFKNINDTFGHDVGDDLLIQVVDRVKKSLRQTDFLARLGGDEFTVLLEDVNREDVIKIADKICNVLSYPFNLKGSETFITVSIGVSIYPDDAEEMSILLKNADMAIYSAKEKGRNAIEFYTQSMNEKMVKRMSLEADLRSAMEKDELSIYYQPVMDIASNSIMGLEALIRWQHPTLGFIAPSEFIPIAEESGLIVSIGEWVLRTVCQQNIIWKNTADFPVPLRVSINLSARQFREANLTTIFTSILQDHKVSGNNLTLELTESLIMHDIDHSITVLKSLKALGFCISIDDFGTGYSSLNYLRRFPIDILKIDKSFITDINGNTKMTDDSAAIVNAIIAMAHSLRMKVIAEGVETMEQYYFLKESSCDEIQGYLLSRPVPPEEIAAFLKNAFSVEMYLQQQQSLKGNIPS